MKIGNILKEVQIFTLFENNLYNQILKVRENNSDNNDFTPNKELNNSNNFNNNSINTTFRNTVQRVNREQEMNIRYFDNEENNNYYS